MNNLNEEAVELKIKPRETESVTVEIPKDVLEALRRVSSYKDMSMEALLKFYLGQGLRQDVSKHYSEHVLETTAQVLSQHIQSETKVTTILREIRAAAG